jgi:hypothetical protein
MGNWNRDMELRGEEAMLYCAGTDSVTPVQRLSPKNKGVSPMYPCKQVTEAINLKNKA